MKKRQYKKLLNKSIIYNEKLKKIRAKLGGDTTEVFKDIDTIIDILKKEEEKKNEKTN